MDLINFFVFLSFSINIILSVFLLRKSYKNSYNSIRYLSYFGLAISAWCISMYMYRATDSEESSLFWSRMLYLTASFTPSTFLIFAMSFLDKKIDKTITTLLLLLNVIVAAATLSPKFISSVEIVPNAEKIISFEVYYYYLYTIYIPLIFILGFAFLIYKYFKSKGSNLFKRQLLIILLGSFVSSNIAMFSNLLLPTFGRFELNWLGQISTIIWLTAVAYAILKYKLFDIRLILGRVVYLSLLALLSTLAFYLTAFAYIHFFESAVAIETVSTSVLISYIFVLFYNFVDDYIRQNISSRIINPGFNPNEEIAKFNSQISSILEKETMAKMSLSTIAKTIRPYYKGLILEKDKDKIQLYEDGDKIGVNEQELKIFFDSFEEIDTKYIFTDEIERNFPKELLGKEQLAWKIFKLMKSMKIEIAIPFRHKDKELIGIMLLGQKDGGSPYTSTELKFITELTDLLSVTLARAFLYEEIEILNKTLQTRVDSATAELKVKNDLLEESLRKERDMVDILGHELRTPLGTARNAVLMITSMKDKIDDATFTKYLTIANENLRREKDLLETILQSARMDNDRLQIDMINIDLRKVIENTVEAHTRMAEQKGLEFKTEIPDGSFLVKADEVAVQQVVDNLVSNAIKYTKEGSVIVKVFEDNGRYRVGVVDTGEGVSKENIANLGRKFFRINPYTEGEEKSTETKVVRPGGTGIGIYVVKGLLNAMNSQLDVESELGKGSTFGFALDKAE